jgi:hypothetical protein
VALSFPAASTPRRLGVRVSAAALVVGLAAFGVSRVGELLPDPSNPFAATETVDRSAPAVLHALEDVAEFKAATANYSIVLDVEKDARWLPSFVKGERTVFMAAGEVDATVDLSALGADAITVSEDRRSVTIELPAATLSEAVVDPERSRVVSRERGVVDRVGSMFADNPTGERGLYLRAGHKLDATARADTALVQRAEQNTRRMLEGLLAPLGFETVRVHFASEL